LGLRAHPWERKGIPSFSFPAFFKAKGRFPYQRNWIPKSEMNRILVSPVSILNQKIMVEFPEPAGELVLTEALGYHECLPGITLI